MTTLADCCHKYEADLARLSTVYSLSPITDAHRRANRNVFDKLMQMQCKVDVDGVVHAHTRHIDDITASRAANCANRSNADTSERISCCYPSCTSRPENDVKSDFRCTEIANNTTKSPMCAQLTSADYVHSLPQVLPIPDVHKVSDCDLIYRFLIARDMDETRTLDDILAYIAFRRKYRLDTILWDHDLHELLHGGDGPELLADVIHEMEKNSPENDDCANGRNGSSGGGMANTSSNTTTHSTRTQHFFHFFKSSSTSVCACEVPQAKLNVRPLLQPGWGASVCGVDRAGHVLLYHRVSMKNLLLLLQRWPCSENTRGDDKSMAKTSRGNVVSGPENLLLRLYLRSVEKGRRMAQLLQPQRACDPTTAVSDITMCDKVQIHSESGIGPTSCSNERSKNSASSAMSNAGVSNGTSVANFDHVNDGITCLIDVGAIKLLHLTSGKYKHVVTTFRLFALLTQTYFPKNLHRVLIVNSGFVLGMLFTLMKAWLDPETLSKIVLVDGNCSSNDEKAAVKHKCDDASSSQQSKKVSSAEQKKSKDTALHRHLLNYIDDAFIPDVYGGKLQAYDAPHCYQPGNTYGCAVEKSASDARSDLQTHPYYAAALARIKDSVYPELLKDVWIYEHATGEGATVSANERELFQQHVRACMLQTSGQID